MFVIIDRPRDFRRALAAVAVLLAVGLALPAQALEPEVPLDQALLETWTSTEGLPLNSTFSVNPGPDGYLWVGSRQGVLRFDGVRFTPVDFRETSGPAPEVTDVAFGLDGQAWIASKAGLYRLLTDTMTAELVVSTADRSQHQVEVDASGTLWAWEGGSQLISIDRSGKQTTLDAPAYANVHELTAGKEGMLVAADPGLSWVGGAHPGPIALPAECAGPITAVANAGGTIWFGALGGKALCQAEGGKVTRLAMEGAGHPGEIHWLSVDSHGALWATTSAGAWRYYHGTYSALGERDGLPSTSIKDVEEDGEGSIWLATLEGLVRLRDTPFVTYGVKDGLEADLVEQVRRTRDGTLWVGSYGHGLYRRVGTTFIHFGTEEGLPSDEVRALGEDSAGTLLVGTHAGVARLEGARFSPLPYAEGLVPPGPEQGTIYAFSTDPTGVTWAFGYYGAFVVKDGVLQRPPASSAAPEDKLFHAAPCADGSVWIFGVDRLYHLAHGHFEASPKVPGLRDDKLASGLCREGEVWVGTELSGLYRYRGTTFSHVAPERGVPAEVNGLVLDAHGSAWLSSTGGLYQTPIADLDRAADDPTAPLSLRLFDVADGLKNREFNTHGEPFAWSDADGVLWLPNIKGLVRLDPARVPHNPRPPPVRIEAMRVDTKPVRMTPDLTLAPGSTSFAIDYTGLSLVVPGRVRFRYRLSGVDASWVDAGKRRTAYYTNLAPGSHTFEVQASNDDGVWSDHGATLQFDLEPRFEQTLFFKLLCALGVLLGFGLIYLLRTRQLEHQKEALEQVVRERTSDLEQAKGRAERLLLNVLPAPIAERLKAREGAIADHFEQVTILFADIVGFTTMSAHTSPGALVALLNDLFTRFDALATKHGVEKIKTIGDCYMAVSGVPVARADHAQAMAAMALEMLSELELFNTAQGSALRIRIGINSGPVVAGVIGKSKFIYDLWGDAVNTASRMESHGDPGSVHMSEVTALILGASFQVEDRGVIHVKGKGDMRTFFLRGRKPAPPDGARV